MNTELYACIHAAEFPAQALLRLHTELESVPVAVLQGRATADRVFLQPPGEDQRSGCRHD